MDITLDFCDTRELFAMRQKVVESNLFLLFCLQHMLWITVELAFGYHGEISVAVGVY